MKRLLLAFAALTYACLARDWFVRTGGAGDGSRDKPFGDPAQALEAAQAGDTIHVVGGAYFGKMDSGNWIVRLPNITMLGGYDNGFTERNPWKNPTVLGSNENSRQRRDTTTILRGDYDHSNFVLDGLVLDGQGATYRKPKEGSLEMAPRQILETLVSFSSPGVKVRNCVILNGGTTGLLLRGDGSSLENSTLLNVAYASLVELRGPAPRGMTVRNNTFLFSWTGDTERGGPDGIGLRIGEDVRADVGSNVFLFCDNHGVLLAGRNPNLVTLKDNVFGMNWANVTFYMDGRKFSLNDAGMAEIADAGLGGATGNVALDSVPPGLDAEWVALSQKRLREAGSKPKADKPEDSPSKKDADPKPPSKPFAGPFDPVVAAHLAGEGSGPGARVAALTVHFAPTQPAQGQAASSASSYEKTTWEKFMSAPSLNGKHVEFLAALGRLYELYPFPGVTAEEYAGMELYDVQERPGRPPLTYVKRGTAAQKLIQDAMKWDGNGTPRDVYIVRGTVKQANGVNYAYNRTLLIDTIEPSVPDGGSGAAASGSSAGTSNRPHGRDLFVRAGSSGDGSRGNPFRDPFQALEVAQPGDAIHVATGEYFGKLRGGHWQVHTPNVTMLGGYDAQFTTRNPWTQPTRLGAAGAAGHPGSFLEGSDDHSSFILDGFVFDGKDINVYDGAVLKWRVSASGPLVLLLSPHCEVRNNIFLNGAAGALQMRGDGGAIENNIFVNMNREAVAIGPRENSPYVVRHNTFVATWNERPGAGNSPAGTAIYTRGEMAMAIDSNLFIANDNFALFLTPPPSRIRITNNGFLANRAALVTNGRNLLITDSTMNYFAQAGFNAASGNEIFHGDLPANEAWVKAWAAHGAPRKPPSDGDKKDGESQDAPPVYAPPYPLQQALGMYVADKSVPGAHASDLPVSR